MPSRHWERRAVGNPNVCGVLRRDRGAHAFTEGLPPEYPRPFFCSRPARQQLLEKEHTVKDRCTRCYCGREVKTGLTLFLLF